MARLTPHTRARRYLQASLESGRPGLPSHERDRLHKLMREAEREYGGVRRHAIVGQRRHFDAPLTRNEREHQQHLQRSEGFDAAGLRDERRELERELGEAQTGRERALEAASAGAKAAGGAASSGLGAALGGGSGNTLMYAIGLGFVLLLVYQLVAGKAGQLIASLVGVGTGAARAFIAPVDPIAHLESALGAAPIASAPASSSSANLPPVEGAPSAPNAQGYVAPLQGAKRGRVDQGVDFSATPGAAIRAIGAGTITNIYPFYKGQPAVVERIDAGPARGRSVYYAEQITPLVRVGQRVRAGAEIGRVAPSGTGLELGWAQPGGSPLAQTRGAYVEGTQTPAGLSFSSFLRALGI